MMDCSQERGAFHFFALFGFLAMAALAILFVDHWQRVTALEQHLVHLSHQIELMDLRVKALEGKGP